MKLAEVYITRPGYLVGTAAGSWVTGKIALGITRFLGFTPKPLGVTAKVPGAFPGFWRSAHSSEVAGIGRATTTASRTTAGFGPRLGQPSVGIPRGWSLPVLWDRFKSFLAGACFVAGTPLRTPGGSKPIERFVAGDPILSRDQHDPSGPLNVKVVEEVFLRLAKILVIRVGSQMIRTTDEHPFWVVGKGWTVARELIEGDALLSHDGLRVVVAEVVQTSEWEAVYNLRVADDHTYFVGCDQWGFSVWAHNSCQVTIV